MDTPNTKMQWPLLVGALPMLRGFVRGLIENDERAKEILQEASVRMLAAEDPADPERYAAWARGVVREVIAHDGRRRRARAAEQPLEEGLIEVLRQPIADPEAHLDARASIERIIDFDSEGLELLFRRYVLQESGRELADDLASSPDAMRMRLMRLRSSVSALVRRTRDMFAFAAATLASAASDLPILDF